MTLEEIKKEKKRIQGKINSLENQLENLILQEKVLESGYKIGDTVEVEVDVGNRLKGKSIYKYVPVKITKFFIYSLEKPDFGAKYKHLTKEGQNCDQWNMFYFGSNHRWRPTQSLESLQTEKS